MANFRTIVRIIAIDATQGIAMAMELRNIIFRQHELVRALAAHNRIAPSKAFSGEMVACRLTPAPAVLAEIEAEAGANGKTVETEIPIGFVHEAMMGYCRENDIPVPPGAATSVEVRDGCLVLVVGHDWG